MRPAAQEISTAETWGPVHPGFRVAFSDGRRGRLEKIRVTDGIVELLVEAGAPGGSVAVDGAEVEAILPRKRRILVGSHQGTDDAAGVEAAGGIIRMPSRHSSRIAGPPEEAALVVAPIYINVGDAAEGADLARSLGRQELLAGLVRNHARWQVEVRSPHDDARSFLADVGVALAAWSGGERGVHSHSWLERGDS